MLDERGEWFGIVTLEDFVEQLVGEIDDKPPGEAVGAQLMSVANALSPGRVLLDFDAVSISHAIETVIAAIPEGELPADRRTIVDAFTRHTEQMTNYFGKGVAVPHARLDRIKEPIRAFEGSQGGFDMGHEHDHASVARSNPECNPSRAAASSVRSSVQTHPSIRGSIDKGSGAVGNLTNFKTLIPSGR
ncbi:MAG TPA: PTS sugar transporter subunit IIA [Chthoniobacterales bacterium]|nr:PTS sugar transporter subunit IIA [Chthoniobacterales bacterium]